MFKIDLSDTHLRNLPRLLQIQAQHNAGQVFLRNDQGGITFAEAEKISNALAKGLIKAGVKRGDNVALYMENRVEMVLLALAINKLRAIWVPINTDYKGSWLIDTFEDSQVVLTFTQKSLIESSIGGLTACRTGKVIVIDIDHDDRYHSYESLLGDSLFKPEYEEIDYGDTSAIMWTSGTTGKSKGVMVSHNNWLRPIVKGTSPLYKSQRGDIIMNVLPMYHAAAWNTAILRALVEGVTVVVEKQFSVSKFWQRINKFKVTQSFTLGAMHMFLWNSAKSNADNRNSLRSLQAVPMPPDISSDFEQRFGLTVLGTGYGQSECMMITSEAGHKQKAPDYSMGYATDDLEIKLFDEQDKHVLTGEIGEIRIRPLEDNIVCNGYFGNREASRQAWVDGWFCTGDLARVDENGAYYFNDRKKDAVRYAGRNISTLEVESVVRRLPDVIDVAVYGIPSLEIETEDELKLDVILAASKKMTAEELATYINANAPYYFVPRYIEFVSSLPYTPTNKIQKYRLRELGVTANSWDRVANEFKVQR